MLLKKNLDQLIYEQMKYRIIRGEWEQGVFLDVDQLSEYYEVSRTPILLTLRRMQNEGMLMVSATGKFFFPRYDQQQVRDICRVRLVLELEALDEIKDREIGLNFKALSLISEKCLNSMRSGNINESRNYDLEWHKKLVVATDNKCLIGLYTKVQGQFMVANYLQAFHSQAQQQVAAEDHEKIMSYLKTGDYDSAKKCLSEHIDQACDKILALINNI